MINYELWYADALGNRIEPITHINIPEYVKTVGGLGFLNVAIPFDRSKTYAGQNPDRRIHLYRQPINGALELELICFCRRFRYATNSVGLTSQSISGFDQSELLARRIVAYYANETQTTKTAEADDMMKEVVDENMGSSSATDYDGNAVTGRDITSDGFSIAGDLTDGPSLTKSFAWRNVLSVLQSLQASSKALGTEVYFGIVPNSPTSLIFETKTGQWGADRSITSGINPIVFSLEWGNLVNPSMEFDYTQEASLVYAGGTGKGSNRVIQEDENTESTGLSPFSRREKFTSNNTANPDSVKALAEDEIARRRPIRTVTGTLISTPSAPYGGNGWNIGDLVTVNYLDVQFDTMVKSVSVRMNQRGKETITAKIEDQSL